MSDSVSLAVNGMKCGGCENTVKTQLSALDGVISVTASHLDKRVDIEFDAEKLDIEEIEDCILAAGFTLE